MATIDSAAPWSDGATGCRNQRAPRIGEIQRHKALEIEKSTPISTTNNSSTTVSITTSTIRSTTSNTTSATTSTNNSCSSYNCSNNNQNKFGNNNNSNLTTCTMDNSNDKDDNKISTISKNRIENDQINDEQEKFDGNRDCLSRNFEELQLNKQQIVENETEDEHNLISNRYQNIGNLEVSITSSSNTYSHMISKCLSQSSSTTTITSSSSPTSSSMLLIDSPSIDPSISSSSLSPPLSQSQLSSLTLSSSTILSKQPIMQFIRILPKTQSLDLVDDRCIIDDIDIDDHEDLGSTQKTATEITTNIMHNKEQNQQQQQQHEKHQQQKQHEQNQQLSNTARSHTELPPIPAVHPGKGMIPKIQSLESRPIYPNVPYSPYGSPYGSPRSNRRRAPLKESRRISIEQSGSFLQLNQYKLMDQIGQGSYGLVKLAYSEEDSTHYAMKILSKRKLLRKAGLMGRGPKKTTSPLDRVYREIAVLKKLDHPNVVKLIEVLDDPLEDSLYLVFELVQQGEVICIPTDHPLSEERAWCVFRDALQGLEYLHYQRIIHSDIKPGNLLLGECGRVKIADLGVCNEFFGEDAAMNNGTTAGTPAFRAPETLIPGQHLYSGKATDIWALGATLYGLVYGNVPFVANSVPAVYEKIKNDEINFPDYPAISNDLRDLIENMLNKDPAKRITLPQIKEHVWVTHGSTCPLPSEEENCRLVQISDEDIHTVVKSIPKLDTLILIKTMLKNHSFQNPFARGISGRAPQRGGSRLERFTRAGRSNSAPGAYHLMDRQLSTENILPAVSESVASSCNENSDQTIDG